LTRDQQIAKISGEITELKKERTRADTGGRDSQVASINSQITQKQNELTRLNYASGGFISGPGTATSDSIPAMLSDGEYVIKAASVNKFGKGFLDSINSGILPTFKKGGSVKDAQRNAMIADKKNTPNAAFQAAQARQQEAFDRAAYVAKSQAASKANVDRKGQVLSEMFKNLVFDGSSPEMAALSVLPFGIGKAVGAGAKVVSAGTKTTNATKKFDHVDTIAASQGRGYAPYTRIDRPGGIAAARADADERITGLMGYNMQRYLGNAKEGLYDSPERMDQVARFFRLNKEFIPGGLEMYRIPSAGEVLGRLPQRVGDIYRPGKVTSAATSGDLQQLGQIFTDKTMATGGNQHLAQGIAQIFTRKPIPGIKDLTSFLSTRKADPRLPSQSQFMKEYILGPNTSYRVERFTPGTKNTPAQWTLEAFIENFAKGGIVKPSYFKAGGMVKPSHFARGGMVKPSYFAKGGIVKPSYFSDGGDVDGTDTVPAMLTPGEFVINRSAAQEHRPLLEAVNSGAMSGFLDSMQMPVYNSPQRTYQEGPSGIKYSSARSSESLSSVDNSVYNYNLSVNVEGSNLSANDVANQVMNKIKQVDAQRMRNQVIR
jgi:hypothetical protein